MRRVASAFSSRWKNLACTVAAGKQHNGVGADDGLDYHRTNAAARTARPQFLQEDLSQTFILPSLQRHAMGPYTARLYLRRYVLISSFITKKKTLRNYRIKISHHPYPKYYKKNISIGHFSISFSFFILWCHRFLNWTVLRYYILWIFRYK